MSDAHEQGHDALPPDIATLHQQLLQDSAEWATTIPWTGRMERQLARLAAAEYLIPGNNEGKAMEHQTRQSPYTMVVLRRNARWTIVPLVGGVLALALVVTLIGFFQRHASHPTTTSTASPAMAPVYLTWTDSQGNALGALNGANGKVIWRDSIDGLINGLPLGMTLADGMLYLYGGAQDTSVTQSTANKLTKVRANDGRPLWHVPTRDTPDLAPIVADGVVYVTELENPNPFPQSHIEAFSSDGQPLWNYTSQQMRISAAQVRDHTMYLAEIPQDGSALMQIEALNATTGQRIWRSTPLAGLDGASLILGRTTLLTTTTAGMKDPVTHVFTSTGYLYSLDLATGKRLWSFTGGNALQASFDATGATILAMASTDLDFGASPFPDRFPPSTLYALDAQSGTVRWQHATDGFPSSPVVAGGAVYYTCVLSTHSGAPDASSLTALDGQTGRLLWHQIEALPTLPANGISESLVNPPQVVGTAVYALLLSPTNATLVGAYDAASGQQRWSVALGPEPPEASTRGTPHRSGPDILLTTPTGIMTVAGDPVATTTSIRPIDGKVLWTFAPPQNQASLLISG